MQFRDEISNGTEREIQQGKNGSSKEARCQDVYIYIYKRKDPGWAIRTQP